MAASSDDGQRAAVRRYVSAVVGRPDGCIASVDRFEDGNRHAVYKVTYEYAEGDMRSVVVRVSQSGDPVERAQAEREAQVLKVVGGVAGPLLYDFRVHSAWFDAPSMCMQLVAGRPQELNQVGLTDLERLGVVLCRLHSQPLGGWFGAESVGGIAAYAQGRLRSITAGLVWARDPLPADCQQRLRDAADALDRSWQAQRDSGSFATGEALALLHGDPGPGNILWGPDPVLIDWEYARPGDPADEIAYLFDQNGLTSHQQDAFWRGYRADPAASADPEAVSARVDWWTPVTLLGSALWWVERWVRRAESDAARTVDPGASRQQEYYRDHVLRRLARLDEHLSG